MWVLVAILLLVVGAPVASCMGAGAMVYFQNAGVDLSSIIPMLNNGINSYTYMAIPFFILAGNLMNESGVTEKLINLARAIVGNIRGGLGHVSVLANMFFACISGSAVASTAAIGGLMIPAMDEDGYKREQATAVCVGASCIGPLIPPSIPMIVYSITAGTSIAAMFLAGAVPGIILGIMLMAYCAWIAGKGKIKRYPFTWKGLWKAFVNGIVAIMLPLIILGGIYSGIFTPTEAAAVACIYAFLIGLFVTKKLKLKRIPHLLYNTCLSSANVMLIIGMATVLGRVLTIERIPQTIATFMGSLTSNKFLLLLMIDILLLIVGCLMELSAAVVMLVPCLLPLANMMGLSPTHFGAIVVINLIIGFMTPPVGVCLYAGTSVGNVSFEKLCKAIWPIVIIGIVLILLVTYIPAITTWLPTICGY